MRRFTACILMYVATFATALQAQVPASLAPMDGKATDVGLGANGVLWAIGTDPVPGGRTIHRWNGTAWDRISGGAVRIAVDPQGAAWVVNDVKAIFRWTGSTWQTVPGDAIDVGIGADGTVWVLNGAGIPHRWGNGSWTAIDGRGASIAVGPKGGPWIVGANGAVFHYNLDKKTWTTLPGQAKDISVAADGTAYMVGSPGGKLFRFENGRWVAVHAGAAGERIAAGPRGGIVVARDETSARGLLRAGKLAAAAPLAPPAVGPPIAAPPAAVPPTPAAPPANAPPAAGPPIAAPPAAVPPTPVAPPASAPPIVAAPINPVPNITSPGLNWSSFPGAATDIGLGASGVLWAIGTDTVQGGRTIHRWNGQAWDKIAGGAVRIAVSPAGTPWVINDTNTIFRWTGASWETMPGAATDVGIGADGTVWVLGSDGTPYRWTGSTWTPIDGGGSAIAVGPQGQPWVVNANGDIFRYTMPSGPWENLPGKARDIGVSADGTAYVVGHGPGTVYRLQGKDWVPDTAAAGTRITAGPAGTLMVVKDNTLQVTGTIATPAALAIAPVAGLPRQSSPLHRPSEDAPPLPPPAAPAPAPPQSNPLHRPSEDAPAPPTPAAPAPAPPPSLVIPSGSIVVTGVGPSGPIDPKAPPPSGPTGSASSSVTGGSLVNSAGPMLPGVNTSAPLVTTTYVPSPGILLGSMVCSEGGETTFDVCGKIDPLDLGPYRVAVPTDCPSGSFWDAILGGTCWSCNGHDRTTEKVDSPDACAYEKLFAAAKVASKAFAWDCPSQSFWDGHDGGGCYNCGDGNRTGYAIWTDQACSMLEHEPARFVKNVGCTDHAEWEIGKPRPYPDVTQGKCFACPVMDKDTGDVLIAEKTITSGDQCRVKVRWKPTQVVGKRITGSDLTSQLMGSGELVREILADSEQVTAYLKFRAQELETPAAEVPGFIERHWVDIAANPNEHPVIKAMLLERALEALMEPAGERTPAEQKVLDGFREYAQLKREAVPGDALKMYQAWKRSVDELRAGRKRNIGDLLYYGTVPLDFDTAAQAVASGSSLALGSAGIVGSFAAFKANIVVKTHIVPSPAAAPAAPPPTINAPVNVSTALRQSTTKAGQTILRAPRVAKQVTWAPKVASEATKSKEARVVYNGLNSSLRAIRTLIRGGSLADDAAEGGEVVAAGLRASATGAKTAKDAVEVAQAGRGFVTGARGAITGVSAAAAGAAVITIVWGILLDIAIDQVVAIETAEPTLQAKLDAAKQPIALETTLASDGGPAQLTLLWSSMLEGQSGPDQQLVTAARAAAAEAKAAGYPTGLAFSPVDGTASDIARGEDGSTWIIGDGGAILRRRVGETVWTTLAGGASRVSAGGGDDAWVVNQSGEVYAWQNGKWTLRCGAEPAACGGLGPAADVAVSGAGAVWVVNRAGDVYRYDSTGWFHVLAPVAAKRIDAAGAGVAAIVGADDKVYLLLGEQWADLDAPPVTDVGLDEAGDLWVAWREGGLAFLPAGTTRWQSTSVPGSFAAIAVGSYPAVTGAAGIQIANRGYVYPPAASSSGAPTQPVPVAAPAATGAVVTIPGMTDPEPVSISTIDPARRTITARTAGVASIVTVIVPDAGVFATLTVGRRIWVDRQSGKASLDGTTACCPASFKEGPGTR